MSIRVLVLVLVLVVLKAELPVDMCILSGTTCLLGGLPNCGSDCSGAPMLPLLYIVFNLGFNIAALNLLKTAGAFFPPTRQPHML